MIVLEPAVIVMVMMAVAVIMVMIVVMIVIVGVQELRLDVEDAVEIEGVAAENLVRARSASAAVRCSLA